jgi:hypothetical protein
LGPVKGDADCFSLAGRFAIISSGRQAGSFSSQRLKSEVAMRALSWIAFLVGIVVVGAVFSGLYLMLAALPTVYVLGPDGINLVYEIERVLSLVAGYTTAIYLLRDRLPVRRSTDNPK